MVVFDGRILEEVMKFGVIPKNYIFFSDLIMNHISYQIIISFFQNPRLAKINLHTYLVGHSQT